MAGLIPAIHVLAARSVKDVDARDKPGHDELRIRNGTAPETTSLIATKPAIKMLPSYRQTNLANSIAASRSASSQLDRPL